MRRTLKGWNSTLTAKPIRRKRALVRTETGMVIAGHPWPVDWMPEEPNRKAHETSWRETVTDRAYFFGAKKVWHNTLSIQSEKGWFDLTIFLPRRGEKPGRTLFVELKVRDKDGKINNPSPMQYEMRDAALQAGSEVHSWLWPDDDEVCWQELQR